MTLPSSNIHPSSGSWIPKPKRLMDSVDSVEYYLNESRIVNHCVIGVYLIATVHVVYTGRIPSNQEISFVFFEVSTSFCFHTNDRECAEPLSQGALPLLN